MSLDQEQTLEASYMMQTFARLDVEFTRGEGMSLEGDDGRRYLDFLAGIGVCCLGYAHPALTAAIEAQAHRLLHVSNFFFIEHRGEVAAMLSKLANGDALGARALARAIKSQDGEAVAAASAPRAGEQIWQTFFANSGAEANETSMKLARLFARRKGNKGNTIICLRGSFHGRTHETLAATMQDHLQEPFKPLPDGFIACEPNSIEQLQAIFGEQGSEICAVMVEAIQGESGVHPLTQDFMRAARDLVHSHGGLLISDEVQTGLFRTGAPFASHLFGIHPDIMSLAKGIAGGVPMGACVARREVAEAFEPGDHGSTFGGSPLSVAAAEAVLSELVVGRFGERVSEVGAYMAEQLAALSHVVEVRGAGLMIGCDIDEASGDARDVVARALEAGFVLSATGPRTLRFLPPLICTKTDVGALVAGLADVLG
ncbi:acetylornithine aminotransferase apoenzyme [Coriobacterium glomerans PW2]|uniref:Acetylornithine aminotransferase apoenzyme n=1 Tax=Coriobacterium glomerans (strain ATCC 49209 / DSM 20642 / JCM 10262 / PW2) TaxID=700015 RepID=F2NAQ4_CORGP|nr:aminotransferase class III-fold pyridoxal phosphate-dependent enzyme [Coriobacterium glomerans]AEB07510.1 acetylornithine aminotransferase apoenzyme [Coriobacterium glomerans PW2]